MREHVSVNSPAQTCRLYQLEGAAQRHFDSIISASLGYDFDKQQNIRILFYYA